jgi:hypothetical protein
MTFVEPVALEFDNTQHISSLTSIREDAMWPCSVSYSRRRTMRQIWIYPFARLSLELVKHCIGVRPESYTYRIKFLSLVPLLRSLFFVVLWTNVDSIHFRTSPMQMGWNCQDDRHCDAKRHDTSVRWARLTNYFTMKNWNNNPWVPPNQRNWLMIILSDQGIVASRSRWTQIFQG